uniref:Uncharacterized protein n=1 Tax=Setaria viridis TaxID=4556 RepID=A0A4U6W9Q4_SETVI|nr:hypothetical protein SEVIR_1G133900v2 [Setaria viridis]
MAGLFSSGMELLAIAASLLSDGLELGLRPSRVLPRRLLAPPQINDDLLGGGNLRGQLYGPLLLQSEVFPEPPPEPEEIELSPATFLEGLQDNTPSGTEQREENNQRRKHHTRPPGTTTPSSSPNAEDRVARTLASPPCSACHLPHSMVSSSVKRGLCGSSRDVQCKIDPFRTLGTGLAETRVEAAPAAPDTAVPDAAFEVGTATPEGVGLTDSPGARAPTPIQAATATADAKACPDPFIGATASITDAGVSVPMAAAPSVTATKAGVPAPVVASGAGTSTSTAATPSTAAPRVEIPISVTAASSVAATGVGVPASSTAAVLVVAAGADSPSSVATAVPITAVRATTPVSATIVGTACSPPPRRH